MHIPLVYSQSYNTDLSEFGIDKPFALDRGQCVLDQLEKDLGRKVPYLQPEPISTEDILLVHTPEYLESLKDPRVWLEIFEFKGSEYKPQEARRPLNELIDDIRLKCGGTLAAA